MRRTWHPSWLALAGLLVATAAGGTQPASAVRPTIGLRVEESEGRARLDIVLPPGADPDSVDVQLDGRVVRVLARDHKGRLLRSRRHTLAGMPTEDRARAVRGADGSITVTLEPAEPPTP